LRAEALESFWLFFDVNLDWDEISIIKLSIRASGYTSASSRAQAPHMGAALKSTNKGRLPDRAFANATSTSLFH
jgi:hypothetical protein